MSFTLGVDRAARIIGDLSRCKDTHFKASPPLRGELNQS
jgi:hypothetical protein